MKYHVLVQNNHKMYMHNVKKEKKMLKLSRKKNELLKRIDEIMHYIWDPIGVFGVPSARDAKFCD